MPLRDLPQGSAKAPVAVFARKANDTAVLSSRAFLNIAVSFPILMPLE
jgi:hypothetical protein